MKLLGPLLSLLVAAKCLAQNLRADDPLVAHREHRQLQDSNGSILDVVKGNSDFSILQTALEATNLDKLFDCSWFCWFSHFTVFAPVNAAFEALPDGVLDKLVTEPYRAHLTSILGYHALDSVVTAEDIVNAGRVSAPTLQGESINATFTDPNVFINGGAQVVTADVIADNGIVHAVNQVLLPSFATKTIADLATDAGLSTLVQALVDAGIDGPFADAATTFTVFAPTNEAFEAFFDSLPEAPSAETVQRVLSYHVVPDDVLFARDLSPGAELPTLVDSEVIDVTRRPGFGFHRSAQLNGETNVVSANNLAINGVVHVIDKVLLPSDLRGVATGPTIVDVLSNNENIFSSLIAAVSRADLVETLEGEGPFTVFAPTNTAFANALVALELESLDDIPLETLTNILLYHVVPAKAFFRDLADDSTLPTALEGATISVSLRRFLWFVIGANLNGSTKIIGRDQEGSNGVIHVIDEVLLPPS